MAKKRQIRTRPQAALNGKVTGKRAAAGPTTSQLRHQKQREARQRKLITGGIVTIVVLALVALGLYRSANGPDTSNLAAIASTASAGDDSFAGVHPANFDGSPDAPVQIVEFGDFGCPSCRAWHHAGIKERLKAEFGDQITFVFRHFPVITAQSPKAAEAGQCAAEQGAFWEFHDYVYERAPFESGTAVALGVDNLNGYAAALGLDTAAFSDCLDSGKYRSYVNNDLQTAQLAGAPGTPSFFINNERVGPQYEVMAAVIQRILER